MANFVAYLKLCMMTSKEQGSVRVLPQAKTLPGGTAPIDFKVKGLSLKKAVIITDTFNVYDYAVDVSARK